MIRFRILLFFLLLLIIPINPVLSKDDQLQVADNSYELEQLRKEVAELRAIVKKMEQRQVENASEVKKLELGQVKNKVEIKELAPKQRTDFDVPSVDIRGFGRFQYTYANREFRDAQDRNTNHFANGDLGLLLFSEISQKLSFLGEVLFEFEPDGGTEIDVERYKLNYAYSDALNIGIGRQHSSLGYWNTQFHHATWTHTTIDPPLLFSYEDEGGILPLHFVGLRLSGILEYDAGDILYNMSIANGRGKDTTTIQAIEDFNGDKQVVVALAYEPAALEDFGIGANFLYDVIPSNSGVQGRENEIDELIVGTYVHYTAFPYELLAEYQYIYHDDSRSANSHHGGYLQIAYSFDQVKPYYRFDILNIQSDDAFFLGVEEAQDSIQHSIGVRYDWFPFAALKLEYRRLDSDTVDSNEVITQVDFMF